MFCIGYHLNKNCMYFTKIKRNLIQITIFIFFKILVRKNGIVIKPVKKAFFTG